MNVCTVHPSEVLAEIGRMTEEGPIEEACQFCMNGFNYPDLECLHERETMCSGPLRVVFGISGIAMVMCAHHEADMYRRQDRIAREYR